MDRQKLIVGIDEVGRGCLAGPLVAAAVIIDQPISGLKDSKLLSKLQRELLSIEIYEKALATGVGWVDVTFINKYGLTQSVTKAMELALKKIKMSYDGIVIDGNYNYLSSYPNVTTIVKADNLVLSVSAASVIAKVYRDKWMRQISKKFPSYGFDKNVGYGTKLHLEGLKIHGPCTEHRMFYKPLLAYVKIEAGL